MNSLILNPHKPPYGAIQQFDSLGMMEMLYTPIITALWHQKHDMKGATMDSDPQSSAAPIINIIGEKILFGPVRHDLLPLYLRWYNDFEVNRTRIFTWRPITNEAAQTLYQRISQEEGIGSITFTLYERATARPIGLSYLFNIDYFSQTAEYGIVIGEKDCWGKGYGSEATRLMLDFGFTGLSLRAIRLRTLSFNTRGIGAYRRAGFQEVGRWREAHRLGGRAYDVILMDCLASEFNSPALSTLVPDPE